MSMIDIFSRNHVVLFSLAQNIFTGSPCDNSLIMALILFPIHNDIHDCIYIYIYNYAIYILLLIQDLLHCIVLCMNKEICYLSKPPDTFIILLTTPVRPASFPMFNSLIATGTSYSGPITRDKLLHIII